MKLFNFEKTVRYEPKKGAARIFQLVFYNFFDLVALNLLFILTSLPLFTVGASLAAAGKITALMVLDRPVAVFWQYFHYFKKYFKRACPAGLAVFIPFLIICFSALFYSELSESICFFKIAALISVSAVFFILLVTPYFFYLITLEKGSFGQIAKKAFLLSVYNMKSTFLSFSAVFIMSLIVFFFFPYTIIVLLLFYFSLCSLLGSYCTINAMR
ncbi:MAG: DUF624 domain-containing protein [Clostridiales bacterium]|nr:DUF624 domain-containing protein [Clostridiales bacterium]